MEPCFQAISESINRTPFFPGRKKREEIILVPAHALASYGPALAVRASPRGIGMGLFAETAIAAEGYLAELLGEVVTRDEMEHRVLSWNTAAPRPGRHQCPGGFFYQHTGNGLFIDSRRFGNKARFINHCCRPNAAFVSQFEGGFPRIFVRAVRRIAAQEEVTVDYHRVPLGGYAERCRCGESNCTGLILDASFLPARETLQLIPLAPESADGSTPPSLSAPDPSEAVRLSPSPSAQPYPLPCLTIAGFPEGTRCDDVLMRLENNLKPGFLEMAFSAGDTPRGLVVIVRFQGEEAAADLLGTIIDFGAFQVTVTRTTFGDIRALNRALSQPPRPSSPSPHEEPSGGRDHSETFLQIVRRTRLMATRGYRTSSSPSVDSALRVFGHAEPPMARDPTTAIFDEGITRALVSFVSEVRQPLAPLVATLLSFIAVYRFLYVVYLSRLSLLDALLDVKDNPLFHHHFRVFLCRFYILLLLSSSSSGDALIVESIHAASERGVLSDAVFESIVSATSGPPLPCPFWSLPLRFRESERPQTLQPLPPLRVVSLDPTLAAVGELLSTQDRFLDAMAAAPRERAVARILLIRSLDAVEFHQAALLIIASVNIAFKLRNREKDTLQMLAPLHAVASLAFLSSVLNASLLAAEGAPLFYSELGTVETRVLRSVDFELDLLEPIRSFFGPGSLQPESPLFVPEERSLLRALDPGLLRESSLEDVCEAFARRFFPDRVQGVRLCEAVRGIGAVLDTIYSATS